MLFLAACEENQAKTIMHLLNDDPPSPLIKVKDAMLIKRGNMLHI